MPVRACLVRAARCSGRPGGVLSWITCRSAYGVQQLSGRGVFEGWLCAQMQWTACTCSGASICLLLQTLHPGSQVTWHPRFQGCAYLHKPTAKPLLAHVCISPPQKLCLRMFAQATAKALRVLCPVCPGSSMLTSPLQDGRCCRAA